MKKFLLSLCCLFIAINVVKLFMPNSIPSDISEIYKYCKQNGYSTDYCYLVDFSRHSGLDRFYIYSFKEKKIIHKSLCAQGLGPNYNIFKHEFSNKVGSNLSSLGKYRVGNIRKMYTVQWCTPRGYTVYGLESTNSNALARGILIHNGNPEIQTFPFPCFPVSRGCFAVSNSMMKHIENTKKHTSKPILLYAYK